MTNQTEKHPTQIDKYDALAVAGLVLVCVGVALIHIPTALIVAGVGLIAAGTLGASIKGARRR